MLKHRFKTLFIALLIGASLWMGTGEALAAAPNLSWGSSGESVTALQQELNSRGYWCGTADGIFGSLTYSAVVKFQKDNGLPNTGLVGPLTRQALGWSESPTNPPSRGTRYVTLVATAYCPCDQCNYPYGGKPSYLGYPLGYGIAAVDPRVIPMGSRLYIPGYGYAIAADQGNAIQGNRIDLCFSSHQDALTWGMKTLMVTVL
ncbi:MAG: peptidoglycan-binding protein [Syntrophomonas sp.]